jgi:hypothetical protein
MERRAVVLRHDVRAACFKEVPFGCCTVMLDTSAGKLVWGTSRFCVRHDQQVQPARDHGSLNSSDKARIGEDFAISFLNS